MADRPDDDLLIDAIGVTAGGPITILSRSTLGGGDISRVERVHTSVGTFVVKSHPAPPPGFFNAEAAALAALRESATSLGVPAVVAVNEGSSPFIVLEDLGAGRPLEDFDEAFGRGLALLHRRTGNRFGFDRQTFCGLTHQPNEWASTWVTFYGESRLGYQVALAAKAGHLTAAETRSLESLIARLDSLIGEPTEGPALIHGDLWSGNLHVTARGRPAIIDPAAYFAHREAEFGMMTLFGGFSARVYDAYTDAYPLEDGWRERAPIYQLYHLLNHLNLFGGGYRRQVMAVAAQF